MLLAEFGADVNQANNLRAWLHACVSVWPRHRCVLCCRSAREKPPNGLRVLIVYRAVGVLQPRDMDMSPLLCGRTLPVFCWIC